MTEHSGPPPTATLWRGLVGRCPSCGGGNLFAGYLRVAVGVVWGLVCTVVLGILFTACQAYEYAHAGFGFADHIYGSTFFMATGFHGFHVIVGTIFLTVMLLRALQGHFSPKKHFGFEAAAWYWHFVDVVWLFLFTSIYVWGAGSSYPTH